MARFEFPMDDDGFGLVEIVVSMFILALLSLALLPLFIQGIQQSARTAAIASATQIASSQINVARAQGATCAGIGATPAVPVGAASVYRGVPLHLSTSVGACPSPTPSTTAPGTIRFTVSVIRTDTGATLATASTLILVSGA